MARLSAALGLARSIAIYHGQPWRTARLRRFYGRLLAPGDLAFDIGAHVGNRTRVLHGLGARVVALEPQPLFHRFLKLTLPRDRIVLRAEAVAARPGRLTLRVSSRHPTVSTLSSDWISTVKSADGFEAVRWDRAVEVPVTTLDALIAENGCPRFVKIDVEGMEAEILAGLSQPVPLVAVEYLPAALHIAEACMNRLEALGEYRYNRVEGEDHVFAGDWLRAPAARDSLRLAARNGRSGDLYARLVTPLAAATGPATTGPATVGPAD